MIYLRREDRLGVFGPFMRAYGRADTATRAAVDAAADSYRAGLITAQTYLGRVGMLLGVRLVS